MSSIKGGYFILDLKGERTHNSGDIWELVNRNYKVNNKVVLIHNMKAKNGRILNDFYGEITIINDAGTNNYYGISDINLIYNGTGITSERIEILPNSTTVTTDTVSFPLPIYEEGSTWTASDSPMTATLKLNGNTAYVEVQSPTTDKKIMTNVNMTKSSGTIDWSRYPNQQGDNTFSFKIGGVPVPPSTEYKKMSANVIIKVNPKTKKITCTVDASASEEYGDWFGTGVLD